jgi:molybdate transport system substrate-binding protein
MLAVDSYDHKHASAATASNANDGSPRPSSTASRAKEREANPGRNAMLRHAAVILITVMSAATGQAAEVKILAALAVQDALDPIGASFSRDSGHTARIAYSTVGAIRKRLAAGERADVVVLTSDAVEEMSRSGELSGSGPVAATRTGVAIRAGAVAPEIATIEQFRAALLAAKSVAYTDPKSGGAFGTYFSGELERMGIAQAVNAKAVLRTGSHEIVKSVAAGEAELGVTFISTIVSTPGLKVAGPLPPPLTGMERFSAGVLKESVSRDAGLAFIRALTRAEAKAIWVSSGFETASQQP